ncbi:lysylphosphatidylglycerol synthase transmembrane domain-containing protein [Candidatus Omnitrophota bacterium]
MDLKAKNWLRQIAAVIISLLLLGLLLSKIDVRQARATILASDVRLILLAVVVSLSVNIFFGAVKWRRILTDLGCKLPFKEVLSIRSGCLPLKLIFPLKSSEVFKAFYLHQQKKLSFARGIGSLFLDKGLNLLVALAILLVSLSILDLQFSRVLPIAGLLVIILIVFSDRTRKTLIYFSQKIHPKLSDFTTKLFSSFSDIGFAEKLRLIFYSIIFQFSEFLNTYILFKAVGLSVPFSSVLVFVPLILIINNLPITVLGLGTREALIVFLFAQYGPLPALLSAGMLVSLIEHILPVLVGLFFVKSFLGYFNMKDTEIESRLN